MSSNKNKIIKKKNPKDILTMAECREILRKTITDSSGQNSDKTSEDTLCISHFSVEYVDNAYGFLGDYLKLSIFIENKEISPHIEDCNHNHKINDVKSPYIYFIKSLPIDNVLQRENIESYGLFEKETKIYAELLHVLGGADNNSSKWRPRCYLIRKDVLVFENLSTMGYKILPFGHPINVDHMKRALETVAKMHASSIVYEENVLKRQDTIGRRFEHCLRESSIGPDNEWFLCGLNTVKLLMSRLPEYEHETNERFTNCMRRVYAISESSTKFRNVMSHRDLWVGNLMFKFDSEDFAKPLHCIILDYQTCRYLPPAIDVLYCILISTRRQHRTQYFEYYLEFYYEQFSKELHRHSVCAKSVLPWTEFRSSCDELKVMSLVFNCINAQLVHIPSNIFLEMRENDPEQYDYVCNIHRADFILKYMADNEHYSDHLMECVQEFVQELFGY